MIKQIGILTYFWTLSYAGLGWEEIPYIINKLNNLGLSDEELKRLSLQERDNVLDKNLVLVVMHFQYKVEIFFNEIKYEG